MNKAALRRQKFDMKQNNILFLYNHPSLKHIFETICVLVPRTNQLCHPLTTTSSLWLMIYLLIFYTNFSEYIATRDDP